MREGLAYGCSLWHLQLQPVALTVAACGTYGCRCARASPTRRWSHPSPGVWLTLTPTLALALTLTLILTLHPSPGGRLTLTRTRALTLTLTLTLTRTRTRTLIASAWPPAARELLERLELAGWRQAILAPLRQVRG